MNDPSPAVTWERLPDELVHPSDRGVGRRGAVVYYCYQSERLLYIGQTGNVKARLRNHRRDSAWWKHVTHVYVERVADARDLTAREHEQIVAFDPPFNIAGTSRDEKIHIRPDWR